LPKKQPKRKVARRSGVFLRLDDLRHQGDPGGVQGLQLPEHGLRLNSIPPGDGESVVTDRRRATPGYCELRRREPVLNWCEAHPAECLEARFNYTSPWFAGGPMDRAAANAFDLALASMAVPGQRGNLEGGMTSVDDSNRW
jgi:hypothetical protein